MRQFCGHRPSGSMAVAIVALVVAMSGTAVAASSLVNGDKLIKMNSLSGNRLRNHTVSGKQINLEGLGKVPSAVVADSATSAGHASTADNATNATNASEFGGLPPSTFVHGSGQVFTAHVILTSSSETPIVTVPGIGQLDGSVSGGFVTFLVTGGTNQTGQEVDEIVGQMIQGVSGVVAPSQIAAGASWSPAFGGTGTAYNPSVPRVFTGQFAWGSGSSAHLVTMTVSLFAGSGGGDVMLQGVAS